MLELYKLNEFYLFMYKHYFLLLHSKLQPEFETNCIYCLEISMGWDLGCDFLGHYFQDFLEITIKVEDGVEGSSEDSNSWLGLRKQDSLISLLIGLLDRLCSSLIL